MSFTSTDARYKGSNGYPIDTNAYSTQASDDKGLFVYDWYVETSKTKGTANTNSGHLYGVLDIYLKMSLIGSPSGAFWLTWATDVENTNYDQAPNLDRPTAVGESTTEIFEIPEYNTIILPVSGIMALFVIARKRKQLLAE